MLTEWGEGCANCAHWNPNSPPEKTIKDMTTADLKEFIVKTIKEI